MKTSLIQKIVLGFLIILMSLSIPINGTASSPISSQGEGPIDFVLINPISDTHIQGNFTELEVIVQSPSGTWPEEVIACVWGVNVTLQHCSVGKNGIPLSNNIVSGAPFECFIKNIEVSELQVAFYAKNATGEAQSSNLTIYRSDPEPDLSLSADEIWNNAYNFDLTVSEFLFCEGINSATVNLTLNNLNTTFINPVYDYNNRNWKYTLFRDFGVEEDKNYFANATLFIDGLYFLSNTVNFKVSSVHTTIGTLNPHLETYEEFNVEVDYIITISDSHDLQPEEVKLQLNSNNYTIPLTRIEFFDELYSTPKLNCIGTHWSMTVVLDNYIVHYDFNTFYAVTLWINNGTWVNASHLEVNYTHYDTPAYTIDIMNSTIYITGGNRHWNLTVNLTSQLEGFQVTLWTMIGSFYYITVIFQSPEGGSTSSRMLIEADGSDTDYTDGKIFQLKNILLFDTSLIGPANNKWWGRIGYYFDFNAHWDHGNVLPRYYPQTELFQSYDSGEDAPEGTYGVTPGNYTRLHTITATTSCSKNNTYNEMIKIEVVDIGRIMGSDYIDLRFDYTSSSSCNPDVYYGELTFKRYSESIYASGPPFMYSFTRYYINPEDPTTYPKISVNGMQFIVIIPTNYLAEFDDYMNGTTSAPAYIRNGDKLEWNHEVNAGTGRFTYKYKFSALGMIESFTNSEVCGDYIVSNKLFVAIPEDNLLTIVFIAIAVIAAVTGIISIRKARKPKRKDENSDESEELPKTDLSANLKSN